MGGRPGSPHGPHAPAGRTKELSLVPDIGGMMGHKSPAVIGYPRCLPAVLPQLPQKLQIGKMALRQIGDLCRPVIHLQVDIDMIVRIPWWLQMLVPDSLQVGWQIVLS